MGKRLALLLPLLLLTGCQVTLDNPQVEINLKSETASLWINETDLSKLKVANCDELGETYGSTGVEVVEALSKGRNGCKLSVDSGSFSRILPEGAIPTEIRLEKKNEEEYGELKFLSTTANLVPESSKYTIDYIITLKEPSTINSPAVKVKGNKLFFSILNPDLVEGTPSSEIRKVHPQSYVVSKLKLIPTGSKDIANVNSVTIPPQTRQFVPKTQGSDDMPAKVQNFALLLLVVGFALVGAFAAWRKTKLKELHLVDEQAPVKKWDELNRTTSTDVAQEFPDLNYDRTLNYGWGFKDGELVMTKTELGNLERNGLGGIW